MPGSSLKEDGSISTRDKKQRPEQHPQKPVDKGKPRHLDGQEMGRMEEGQELEPNQASTLQEGLGNQALLGLMARQSGAQQTTPSLEIEIEEEGAEFESDQEMEEIGSESSVSSPQTAILDLPDDEALFWGNKELGGDEDPPKPPAGRPRPRRRRQKPASLPEDPLDSTDGGATRKHEEDLQDIRLETPLDRPEQLLGDEVHDALWGWIQDPTALAQVPLEPESLTGLGDTHPLSRCATAGALLGDCSPVPAGRALGKLARPLPGPSSLSSVVARAAAMATLSQAVTARATGVQAVNRAVSLVLEDDALPQARRMAWELARASRLWAPAIFERCIRPAGPDPLDHGGQGASPLGSALLATALSRVAGPSRLQEVPPCPRPQPVSQEDQDLAWLDAMVPGKGHPAGPDLLTYSALVPVIQGVQGAVRSAAELQVELAAAATAAWRVAGAPVRFQLRGVLRALWRELGIVAREALGVSEGLERKVGQPLAELEAAMDRADECLGDLGQRLTFLREDGLAALAVVLARGTRPVEQVVP